MTPSEGNRFAPPVALVEDVAVAGTAIVLGGRIERLGAAIIDGLIVGLPLWAIGWGSGMTNSYLRLNDNSFLPRLGFVILAYAMFVLFNGVFLMRSGQTIGKKALGLRITLLDGSLPAAGRLIGLRYGIGYLVLLVPAIQALYSLVDCLMIFGSARRCLHDRIAGTIVVRA